MTIKELEIAMQVKFSEATEAQLHWEAELEEMDRLQEAMDEAEDRLLTYRDERVAATYEIYEKLGEEYNQLAEELERRTKGLEGTKLPYPVPMVCG